MRLDHVRLSLVNLVNTDTIKVLDKLLGELNITLSNSENIYNPDRLRLMDVNQFPEARISYSDFDPHNQDSPQKGNWVKIDLLCNPSKKMFIGGLEDLGNEYQILVHYGEIIITKLTRTDEEKVEYKLAYAEVKE